MAANIPVTLSSWSTTASSNQPDSTDLASTLREDLQAIQAAVRYLRTAGTIASAGTTDLATKSEEILSVSGTTTITALGTVSAGMIKVLVFEGALTFTHNGTSLILPSAANITTAAGDVAVMLSLGSGNWRCIDYQKANGQSVATVGVANGGTNITSYAVGDLIYASGTTTLSKLADVAVGAVLVSGGVGVAPAWDTTPEIAGLTVNGAVGITTGGLGVVGGITVTTGDILGYGIVKGGVANTSYCYITADGTNSIHAFDNGDYIGYTRSSNTYSFVIGNAAQVYITDGNLIPAVDNDIALGGSSNKWTAVYATNGTIQTSDKRRKEHVGAITDPGTTIDALQPVRFKWKSTGLPDAGFYAQDVAPLIPEAVVPGTETVDWGMMPDRLIPFLVAEIQSLRRRVAKLEAR